ncbi:bifunctional phosphopantothenoylcysteine decarboxylase/phosphopantothenate--cysteine ligase CoaBC [Oceanobacillus profundus]|uniref:Coenzyme A biosynthesis bifunctional protein CoaBC n=1 Tax=Oceanobacillus profundus TaxID=372463 RepID=A0A417YKQ8_9BACI|nr:bifunctional phosphopantothenoylcysteine decarboxylase/phosphopantothenate--cysteine ligase CoaBC [Oceanobacillus profundus]MBR3119446.1 bifunctional phosphopantothenoylcysteine decarboxylase/phosphopantothenate--cysteine ligase CoaBC [Oceanobacillus sp.]MDO6449704.1 bifunctional phosphopantothenoylcysteine decarboxylase/phosphopantothenate--cysteine ligase CoaBC [Oceanobacillus profundus]PAE29966.1 bifunctional phosphopantothenoylcysteine decarboxylase/phosphopantothenate--cysteine ligase Co
MVNQKNILLGVSGGIAVYKACALASKLTQKGANVKVMMTESAAKFVSPLTFQALSRNPVYIDTFDEKNPKKIAHIDVADWADIAIIAPATANIIGKLANGIADDMLSTTLLATEADVYIAPAMNVHMYAHPAVIQNMKQLEDWGYHFIEPGAGYLACGYVGKGRLEEPESIIAAVESHQLKEQMLAGKKVLISAGPTREKVDPVRFFTNRSSGKMGYALAEVAAELGAEVTLVSGPVSERISHPKVKRVSVLTAEDMYKAMHAHFADQDIVIKAAAVADYRPKLVHEQKVKKQDGNWQIEMERTKDILKSLGEMKTNQFLVGFAAETNNPLEYGEKKLLQKHLDAIVVNDVSAEGAGFEGDTNMVTYLNKAMHQDEVSIASKREVAARILEFIDRDMKDE